MKSRIYFIALLALFSLQHQAQWNLIDTLTYGNLNSINFINADTGFAHNEQGIMRRTWDGGQSWDTMSIKFTGYVYDVDFGSAMVGYAVGGAWFPHSTYYPLAILKTIDGGLTWDSIFSGGSGGVFSHVEVLSDNEFFATSQYGMIHSDDGGQTFDTVSVSNLPWGTEQYSRIRFLSATHGYVLSRSNSFVGNLQNLYETTDGGKTWQSIHDDSTYNFSNDFVMTASGTGVIVGNDSYVLRTTNNGANWQKIPLTNLTLLLTQIEEVDGHLFALGSVGADTTSGVYYSSDWGDTWQQQFSIHWRTGGVVDLSIPSADAGYFVTWRDIYKNDQLVSLEETQSIHFEIYPNPASEILSIKLRESDKASYNIYNILGKKVIDGVLDNDGVNRISVGHLNSGVYVLEVFQGGTSVTRKWIKE